MTLAGARGPNRHRGFQRTSALIAGRVRAVGETRGFAVSRLLTHWADVAGADIAAVSRPVEVSYGRGGFGATLTLLTTGAQAPMLEMQAEHIRERVNACYGYAAISRVRVTQTAPTGFSEGRVAFSPAPEPATAPVPAPETMARAAKTAAPVRDPDLRAALEQLGGNVLSRRESSHKG